MNFGNTSKPNYWYQVVIEPKGTTLVGSSPLNEADFVRCLETQKFILLENLYFKDGEHNFHDWKVWNPHTFGSMYINTNSIASLEVMSGKPV